MHDFLSCSLVIACLRNIVANVAVCMMCNTMHCGASPSKPDMQICYLANELYECVLCLNADIHIL